MTAPSMLALESGEQRQDPQLFTYGVLAVATSLVVAFGALFGAFLSLRSGTAVWPPKGATIQNYWGTTQSITMLMGAVAAEWAAHAIRRQERGQAVAGLGLLLVFGLAFLNLLTYVVHVAHFGPATHPYGAVYFAFAVLMGASIVGVIVFTTITLARLLGRQVSEREPALIRSTACLWHATMLGWFVMYTAIYVVK
jgi:heme/copper-type cytochrome/quinol oxidase subunit 3